MESFKINHCTAINVSFGERRVGLNLCQFLVQKLDYNEEDKMNKSELIEAIASSAQLSKADAGRALEGFTNAITQALQAGDTISLIGFGTFSVKERAARKGRNPKTGQEIDIAASKVPDFKAGKGLKDAIAS